MWLVSGIIVPPSRLVRRWRRLWSTAEAGTIRTMTSSSKRSLRPTTTTTGITPFSMRPVNTLVSPSPDLLTKTSYFAPKCLALVSRHNYPEVLRNILCVIYTVYVESLVGFGGEKIKIEQLVGNLLGSVRVPAEGQNHAYFSLGASDKILIQPPISSTVPNTGERVAHLFLQLGIKNVIRLLMAALTEHKILFFSRSFSRLTDSCMALIALMFPLKYSHVFIPILPSSLIEVLATPTPFIIGLHSLYKKEVSLELHDVIFVDLDGGAINLPENFQISMANEELLEKLCFELSLVLKPDLEEADMAFFSGKKELSTFNLYQIQS